MSMVMGLGSLDMAQWAQPQLLEIKIIWIGTRKQLAKFDMATLATEFPNLVFLI